MLLREPFDWVGRYNAVDLVRKIDVGFQVVLRCEWRHPTVALCGDAIIEAVSAG